MYHQTYFKGNKYGANRQKNNDYKYSRLCKQCGEQYYKDKRLSQISWNKTKYCSPKCQTLASKIHKNSRAKLEAWRRKNGVLKMGSAELSNMISKNTKLAMQRPEVQEKIRQPREALSLERRMEISDKLAGKMPKNMTYDNSKYSHIKRGYYDINGTTMFFRSKWEANYALYLDFLIDHKQIYKWEFESDTFMFEAIKLGTRSYTPDFKVYKTKDNFEYHEVKGYMDSKSKTKLKRFAKYYPEHKLLLIQREEYTLITKQIGKLCGFY